MLARAYEFKSRQPHHMKFQARGFVPALLRYSKGGIHVTEIFSDSARGNFLKNQDELSARLKSVERCINNDENIREVNIEFCKRAFRLLADCGLINEENVRFLSDAAACAEYDPKLKFPYNKTEGVLRKTESDYHRYQLVRRSADRRQRPPRQQAGVL